MRNVSLTASGKEQALVNFYAQLRRDGIPTVTVLAARTHVGRAHLARLLSANCNGRQTGRFTWKHILPVLSPAALFALKQCSAWNDWAEKALVEFEKSKPQPGEAT